MENRVTFRSGEYKIEGLFGKINQESGVVITHPHPLYGGEMYNYIVEAIVNAYQKKGFSTLRFNFRGVGKSQGQQDDISGNQEDVKAAVSYMANTGIKNISLAGYSFGAWINAHIDCDTAGISQMVMVSPPVNFLKFDNISSIPCLKLVVCGDKDEFAQEELVKKMTSGWNPEAKVEIIPNTDHFYGLSLRNLEIILENFLGAERSTSSQF
ncbi:Alpha/beta hydrolase fold-containing protein [Desulfonema limicola]|uniref:Alpha/beta hydrolase fold-containing protein n=1 Tax=Desulfonema limicola TaxID=45656 RepID=A0A975B5G3_9BACT|nr:alpha/beta family hydrolase [Desulfonema limicola]QTA79127.1 Alpha/beta hydrolase fold-containing protein [Desulfonema limicola]